MPRPKVNKVLAYRKCQQCRKDRQKCLPEGRSWPGRRCDRCQRYNYACSANRTKDEEIAPSNLGTVTRDEAGSEARETSFSPELRSLPHVDAESETRYLQELGDYHQIFSIDEKLDFLHWNMFEKFIIGERVENCVKKITAGARTHQTQGRYKDAEYLYRQLEAASAPLDPSADDLLDPEPDMVLIYEKLGNLPAAEILQEHRLLYFMLPEHLSDDTIFSVEAENLFRLYILFLARVEDLNVMSTTEVLLMIFYRIAVLGCSLLNELLFKSELWTQYNPDLCLRIAIRTQSTEMIRGLISIGVDLNQSSDSFYTPLLTAAQCGNLDNLKLLLENNVDVGAKNPFKRTALHYAMLRDAKQRDETHEIICLLIKAGVDVNAVDSNLRTALHSAIYYGREPEEEVVHCLIEAGINIEAKDYIKETALEKAVERGYLTTAKLLLQQGANTEVDGDKRETPLFYAVRKRDESMVELLLDHGANTEGKDFRGETPLHLAVRSRQIETVRMLLRRGASAAAYDGLSHTPVDIARSNNDRILLDILLGFEN